MVRAKGGLIKAESYLGLQDFAGHIVSIRDGAHARYIRTQSQRMKSERPQSKYIDAEKNNR